MYDLIYNRDFVKENFNFTASNIDLSILTHQPFTGFFLSKNNVNKLLSKYLINNRKTIEEYVIKNLLIYQPNEANYDSLNSYVLESIALEILSSDYAIEGVWDLKELVDINLVYQSLIEYYFKWVNPLLDKTLYNLFDRDSYIMSCMDYIEHNFLDLSDSDLSGIWCIENIQCKINSMLARRDFLMITILKINKRK